MAWVTAHLSYGVALFLFLGIGGLRARLGYYARLILIFVQMLTALVVVMLPVVAGHSSNSTPALLVIIAACLPYLAPSQRAAGVPGASATLRPAWIWSILVVLVVVNVAILFAVDRSWTESLTFGLTMGGFMLFAAASSFLVRSEADARSQLATVNAELLATRALLVESSRADERLRISRDLHDTLGHHLTALSLQLDVAARLSQGKVANHIRQAHAITRLLLGDVRDVVSRLRDTSQLDLAHSIRALAAQHRFGPAKARYEEEGASPAKSGHYEQGAEVVAIHLEIPETLVVEDAARAEILLRCVQEIITNTVRHAHAANLWIRLDVRSGGIALHARDDGRGADGVTLGNGLTGMRERFAQYAGHVEFVPGHGAGFEIRGFLPTPAAA
jgi:signal transduction histidine kinase